MINRKAFLLNAIEEGFKNDVSGYPLSLKHSKGKNLKDYKIYGNSVQDGTPTPDNPIEVESVGDKTTNMIDYARISNKTINGITYTNNNDGTYTANGTLTTTLSSFNFTYYIDLTDIKQGVKYYISCGNDLNNSDRRYYLFVIIKNISTGRVRYFSSYQKTKTFTLSEEEEVTSLELRIYAPTGELFSVENVVFRPILCKASEYVGYEPYGYKIPIKVSGKNLLNISDIEANDTQQIISCYIDKTATISAIEDNLSISTYIWRIRIKLLDGSYVYITDANYGYNHFPYTINVDSDNPIVEITTRSTNITEGAYRNIQIEYGETATGYEPYVEPKTTNIYLDEPLRKIGDYADYIDFKNQKVIRNIVEINLSNLSWITNSTSSLNGRFWAKPDSDIVYADGTGVVSNFLCTNYIVAKYSDYTTKDKIIYSSSNTKVIYVKDEDYTDLEIFKNAIKGILLAQLETPTEETIDLPNIPTHKGTNIIKVDTIVEASNLNVSYKSFEKGE